MDAIVAVCSDWAIGKDGGLLVRNKEDMHRFVQLTRGCTVVMGRKTYESFPGGPLKGRRNVIVTHDASYVPPEARGLGMVFQAFAVWPHMKYKANEIDYYSRNATDIRGDITFYGSSSTTGYLGVLKHSSPGFLSEGYFHTYQPARHRALNLDYCKMEGVRYARGIRDYFSLNNTGKGYIIGTVKDLNKTLEHSLYHYKSGSIDANLPINGATSAGQSVMSYNYGAKKYDRVSQCIRFVLLAGLTINTLMWALVMFVPRPLIRIFTDDEELVKLTVGCARIYFGAFPFMALQVTGQHTFVALNYPKHALCFSLLRKIVLVAPLTLLLPNLGLGAKGVFWAEFISQVVGASACFTTMSLVIWRKMRRGSPSE